MWIRKAATTCADRARQVRGPTRHPTHHHDRDSLHRPTSHCQTPCSPTRLPLCSGYAGDGTTCYPCTLKVSIPFASFTGTTALRSSTIKLYGAPVAPTAILGFACNSTGGLSLQWTGETANSDTIPVSFDEGGNSRTLVLPPRKLPASIPVRFTLRACWAGNPDSSLCGAQQTQFVGVSSALVAVLSGGSSVVGKGAVTLDASGSMDPDGDDAPVAFSWSCTPPAGTPLGAPNPPVEGWEGCLAADGSAIRLETVTTPSVALALLGSPDGANYTLSVRFSKGERFATASAWVVIKAGVELPVVSIQGLSAAKLVAEEKQTFRASVKSSPAEGEVTTLWSVVSTEGAAKPFNLTAPGVAGTPLSSSSLVLNAGVLPHLSVVTLRLSATNARGGTSSALLTVPVSGVPSGLAGAARGGCTVDPPVGTGLATRFIVSAPGWTDADLPLTYAFAYTVDGMDSPPTSLVDFKPQSSVAGLLLPAGSATGEYVVRVMCSVQNAFGAIAKSDPVAVKVTWDQDMLSDPAAQAALVDKKAEESINQVLSGNTDLALSNIVGLSSLLNVASAMRRRSASHRRNLLSEEDKAQAQHRENLLGIISTAVDISLPAASVRSLPRV